MEHPNLLKDKTGKNHTWWISTIQGKISKNTKPTKNPKHGQTDSKKVFKELIDLIERSFPKEGREKYDGNMRMASLLSLVTALWFVNVQRAKILDPCRPIRLRKKASKALLHYHISMVKILMEDQNLAAYFPSQNFDYPFSPDAVDGDFV